jgi:hypothetical protein
MSILMNLISCLGEHPLHWHFPFFALCYLQILLFPFSLYSFLLTFIPVYWPSLSLLTLTHFWYFILTSHPSGLTTLTLLFLEEPTQFGRETFPLRFPQSELSTRGICCVSNMIYSTGILQSIQRSSFLCANIYTHFVSVSPIFWTSSLFLT